MLFEMYHVYGVVFFCFIVTPTLNTVKTIVSAAVVVGTRSPVP